MFLYLQTATLLSAGVLVDPPSFFKILNGRCAQYSIVLCLVFFSQFT